MLHAEDGAANNVHASLDCRTVRLGRGVFDMVGRQQ